MAYLNLKIDVLDYPAKKASSFSLPNASSEHQGTSQSAKIMIAFEAKLAVILQDHLQPDSKTSLELAADSILGLLPSNAQYDAEMFAFAQLCVEIAEQIPYHHPSQAKLVRLLKYLARSPKLVSQTKTQGGKELYHSYQALGEVSRDNLRDPVAFEPPAHYVNYHAFLARMESISVWREDPTYAIWTMRDAFEEAAKEAWEKEYCVMAAAQWIFWNGQNLFTQFLFPDKTSSDDRKAWRFGSLYTGGGGFLSMERWGFWKKGFAAVEDSEWGVECKRIASKALELMGAMERTMTF